MAEAESAVRLEEALDVASGEAARLGDSARELMALRATVPVGASAWLARFPRVKEQLRRLARGAGSRRPGAT